MSLRSFLPSFNRKTQPFEVAFGETAVPFGKILKV